METLSEILSSLLAVNIQILFGYFDFLEFIIKRLWNRKVVIVGRKMRKKK